MAGRHLPGLDGLRAIAVFTVIVYHFGIGAVPGDLGVSGFFVLSGFLITWLLLKEYQATGTVSLRRFYTRRLLRIFPAYYVFLAATFALDYVRGDRWAPGLLQSGVFYLVNYYNALHGHPTTSIAHAWSLAIEEQFYLLWPLLLLVLLRGGRRRAARVLGGLIVAVVAWRSVAYLGLHLGSAYVYNAFDTRFDNLAIGCGLALCADSRGIQRVAGLVTSSSLAPVATLGLIVLSRIGIGATYHYTLGYTIEAILVAVLIVQMLLLHRTRAWSWLESPMVRYLGAISYPLYLWHAWGLTIGHRFTMAGVAGEFVAGVLACVLLASGSYYLVERRFLALKPKFAAAAAPSAHVTPSPATSAETAVA